MSNYNNLKTTIDANIKQNGNQEITGPILNSVLNQMVNILGTGYQFAGVAVLDTDPGTPDAKVFYIANGKGKYEKFGGLEVTEDEVVVLYWDSAWHKVSTGIASQAKLSELEKVVGTYSASASSVNNGKNFIFGGLAFNVGDEFVMYIDCSNDGRLIVSTDADSTHRLIDGDTYNKVPIKLKAFEKISSLYVWNFTGSVASISVKVTCGVAMDVSKNADGILEINNRYEKSTNLYDRNKITRNYFVNSQNGRLSSNPAYGATDYIEIVGGETYIANSYGQCAWYDEDKVYISGNANWNTPVTAPTNAKYLRGSIDINLIKVGQVNQGSIILPYEAFGVRLKDIYSPKSVRKIVCIHVTDSEIDIYNKMNEAFLIGNCDVYWENGTYVFSDLYPYLKETLHKSWTMGLPIGNNCKYYFNGAILVSNAPSVEYDNNRNILDTMASASSFEIHDGILINNGGTYCVHDEANQDNKEYRHLYYNMRMEYNDGPTSEDISKCIGGGAGIKGNVILDGCVINSGGTREDMSFHGTNNQTKGTMTYLVRNCYFGHHIRIGVTSAEEKAIITYCGNSSLADIAISETCELYDFNNSIR